MGIRTKKIKKKIAWHLYQKKILNNCDYIHATSDDEKKHLGRTWNKNSHQNYSSWGNNKIN